MPLQQILCRLSERNNRELKQRSKVPSLLDKMQENRPVTAFFDDMHSTQQFKQIRAGGFIIKASVKGWLCNAEEWAYWHGSKHC